MGRRRGIEQDKALSNPVPRPETAQNASYCVSCGLAKHPGSTCYAASLIAARIRAEQEQPDSTLDAPQADDDIPSSNTPDAVPMSSNRQARHRLRNPEWYRAYMRDYMRAYRARGRA